MVTPGKEIARCGGAPERSESPDPVADRSLIPVGPRDEVRALTRLAFGELATAADGIGTVHRAIADRVFAAVGPGGHVVKLTHHAISGGVYASVRGGSRLAGRAADVALAHRAASKPEPISTHPRGSALLGVLNGLIGDALERERSELDQAMTVRSGGRIVPPRPAAAARAFPRATPRLAVFLHGLFETELAWRLGSAEGREPYGARLERELGFTPVYIRYNTGRHISENGHSLTELLAALVSAWPVEVEEIALIGHSMGGLVARSACHLASEEGTDWVGRVRRVVSLGTPHMGSPVAQAVHYASAGLGVFPESRPFANFLRRRSAGVRDLRQGSLVDEDWRDHDPDALRAAAINEVPLLEGATHYFITATVSRSEKSPLGRLIGDTLVLVPSGSGRSRSRRIGFREEDGAHVGGATHFALLNHPAVYERMREWLGGNYS